MIPNSIVYPFNFINRRGIPLIESASAEVTDTQVVITITNRAFRFLDDRGVFLFRLNQPIPAGGEALPIIFSWTGFLQTFTQPLTITGNAAATGDQLGGTGIYLVYYDKACNLLQLMTNSIGTEQATSSDSNS